MPISDFRPMSNFHKGAGAIVRLDYGSRDEFSFDFLGDSWESLYDLIVAPGVFMEMIRKSYKGVPKSSFPFESPITIILEPLTIGSPQNLAVLMGLSPLYDFSGAIKGSGLFPLSRPNKPSPNESPRPAGTLESFRSAVIGGASKPVSPIAPISDLNTPVVPARFYYIAEFALNTRTLTIRYVPPAPGQVTWARRYAGDLTTVTMNEIAFTNLKYMHFDADLSKVQAPNRTELLIAQTRAQLVMDFVDKPSGLGDALAAHQLTYKWSGGVVTWTDPQNNVLPLTIPPAGTTTPDLTKKTYDSRVVIDSVKPNPFDPQGNDILTASSPCIMITLVPNPSPPPNYLEVQILVKNYEPTP